MQKIGFWIAIATLIVVIVLVVMQFTNKQVIKANADGTLTASTKPFGIGAETKKLPTTK